MANTAANPLAKHFRQPSIYLRLPSKGRFYKEGTLELSATGEIPVYPMTVKDEITLKTPDALMSGQGMVDVIKSCCPAIKDPWSMPAVDVDTVLIAIRLASYGQGMDISTDCPHCNVENENTVDLRVMLDNLKVADYTQTCTIEGLTFHFKPQQFKNINQTNMIAFEQQRLIDSILANESLSDQEKSEKFNESFNKLKSMNIDAVANNIESIVTEDGTEVTDRAQITEFLDNCSRMIYDGIKKFSEELVDLNKLDPIHLTCNECTKEYDTPLTFDQSNFFA